MENGWVSLVPVFSDRPVEVISIFSAVFLSRKSKAEAERRKKSLQGAFYI